MNLRKLFRTASLHLAAEFEKSAQFKHSGEKGGKREGSFKENLRKVLPARFGLGRGEVVTSRNEVSKQCDLIIFDAERGLELLHDEGSGLYPIESVYGTIEVKSDLDSTELEKAYQNVGSVKRLVPPGSGFVRKTYGGSFISESGSDAPVPIGIVFAFTAGRSLKAIGDQVAQLDAELDDLRNRPDLVVVFDQGIVGPQGRVRGDFNNLRLSDRVELHRIQRSGRHTLLRFYMQLLDELTVIGLPPLDLRKYLTIPDIIDGHRITGHDRIILQQKPDVVYKVNVQGIRQILKRCGSNPPITYEQVLELQFGQVPQGVVNMQGLKQLMRVYNPNNLPPFDPQQLTICDTGQTIYKSQWFAPIFITIDDEVYAIDLSALGDADLDERDDLNLGELLDEDKFLVALDQQNARLHKSAKR